MDGVPLSQDYPVTNDRAISRMNYFQKTSGHPK